MSDGKHRFTLPYPFCAALAVCIEQATSGKGEERHAHGAPFVAQVWTRLARDHGRGFLTGQAEKKWIEANNSIIASSDERWVREVAGAINYALMALIAVEFPDVIAGKATSEQLRLSPAVWLSGAWPVVQPRTSPKTLEWPRAESMRTAELLVALQNAVLHMAAAMCQRLEKMGIVPPPVTFPAVGGKPDGSTLK